MDLQIQWRRRRTTDIVSWSTAVRAVTTCPTERGARTMTVDEKTHMWTCWPTNTVRHRRPKEGKKGRRRVVQTASTILVVSKYKSGRALPAVFSPTRGPDAQNRQSAPSQILRRYKADPRVSSMAL